MRTITDKDYAEVLKTPGTVLLEMGAEHCGPCKILAMELEKLQQIRTDLTIVKANIEDSPEIAGATMISSVPSLVYYQNGEIKHKVVGYRSHQIIQRTLEELGL